MSILDSSLALARQNVRLFPCVFGKKVPAIEQYSERATSNPEELKKMFSEGRINSGIATGKYGEGLYLVALDIDNKDGKNGYRTLEELDLIDGLCFPKTWSQKTTTGGEHRLYWSPLPIKQGAGMFGPDSGIDTRCEGGYVVGPGSVINGRSYEELEKLPIYTLSSDDWFVTRFQKKESAPKMKMEVSTVLDQPLALKRSVEYLGSLPVVHEGQRNAECYKAVCKLKDLGLNKMDIPSAILAHWNCEPMLEISEVIQTVESAYKSSQNPPGIEAPENIFDAIPEEPKEKDFVDEYNERFFYCAMNGVGRICEEFFIRGKFKLERYPPSVFHDMLLSEHEQVRKGDRIVTVHRSKLWMESERRRRYRVIRFIPTHEKMEGIYNLWRGFAVKPFSQGIVSAEGHRGFQNFLLHCKENICDSDEASFDWLMDFAAHLFQKPEEKPHVAVVMQGRKGTGKTIFTKILNHLIGPNSISIPNRTHITNNFNSIMEDKLLITLEEAFWSGDKATEGILKAMITDNVRNVERKGEEPYSTDVYDRIIIIGNEEQLINASGDERRFAVFNVGDKKRGDTRFFGDLAEGITEHGGDALLMKYFMERDISNFNPRKAPETVGLREQKTFSRSDFENFWFECLQIGQIGPMEWPTTLSTKTLYGSFLSYFEEFSNSRYKPSASVIGKQFKHFAPSCADRKQRRHEGVKDWFYEFCTLEQARKEWEEAMGMTEVWE